MFQTPSDRPGRIRDVQGNVPLHVVVWLEQHPTASLATALAATAKNVRWLYRVSPTVEVVLRGDRVEVVDRPSGTRIGSARIHGVRSAHDFDTLPRAVEPPPFTPPDVPYPAAAGFACDSEGRVARFQVADAAGNAGPCLIPRLDSYPHAEPKLPAMVDALAATHGSPAYPTAAFAARVKDLVSVLSLPAVVGSGRLYSWFEDDRVVIWPQQPSELVTLAVSQLHARKACLGCSKHDPRDALGRGTYSYARPPHSTLQSFVRDEVPAEPLNIADAARLLGRSVAELAATQLPVQFATATRVDLTQMRWAT